VELEGEGVGEAQEDGEGVWLSTQPKQ
jgi:hypothetical protein